VGLKDGGLPGFIEIEIEIAIPILPLAFFINPVDKKRVAHGRRGNPEAAPAS